MRLKTTIGILLLLLSATVFAVLALNSPKITAAKLARGEVQLEVLQLPADKGVIPVEIREEKISSNPADGAMEASFLVKNNTGKNIDAISVAVTGRIDRNGKETLSTGYLTINSLVHPDIREIHHQHPLGPGEEWSFKTEPLETEDTKAGAMLRGITLQIDYLDFEDRTELGPNKYGSNVVTKARTGAAKYKEWLVKKYAENGRSVAALLPLLARSQALPTELDLGDHERTGARLYQSHLLKAYQQHGAAEVEKFLKRYNKFSRSHRRLGDF
jgi:hypothetical protein